MRPECKITLMCTVSPSEFSLDKSRINLRFCHNIKVCLDSNSILREINP